MNKFNSIWKQINFAIPKTDLVTLKIYDILCKEVEALVNKEMRPGNYTAYFNGNGLSSGMYIYRLKGNNFIINKKMLLLKYHVSVESEFLI